jgi:hypothetical protein
MDRGMDRVNNQSPYSSTLNLSNGFNNLQLYKTVVANEQMGFNPIQSANATKGVAS